MRERKTWLVRESFTVAAGCLFNITNASVPTPIGLSPCPNLLTGRARGRAVGGAGGDAGGAEGRGAGV